MADADDGEPFWLSPWPFREPTWPPPDDED
ncbi:hypothetical protein M2155_000558 [Streptomyces sp. SAI-119]|nr:hypothetical protein [Streptomyces sp. SAI-119]